MSFPVCLRGETETETTMRLDRWAGKLLAVGQGSFNRSSMRLDGVSGYA